MESGCMDFMNQMNFPLMLHLMVSMSLDWNR